MIQGQHFGDGLLDKDLLEQKISGLSVPGVKQKPGIFVVYKTGIHPGTAERSAGKC